VQQDDGRTGARAAQFNMEWHARFDIEWHARFNMEWHAR
jgi:hypothetical protein